MSEGAGGASVELTAITKRYGSLAALDGADLTAFSGEVHALLGENGAGKSTLAGVLAGSVSPDAGRVRVAGVEHRFASPMDSVNASIGIVHQHFKLVPALSALENIALGAVRQLGGFRLDLGAVDRRAREISRSVGLELHLDRRVEGMSVGERQRVEIVKLLFADPQILVLDEPTAVLTPGEVLQLAGTLRALADEGRTVLVIAHKLDEVLAMADRVTVLRRGRTVLEDVRSGVDASVLAKAMVGEDLPDAVRPATPHVGPLVARLAAFSASPSRGGPRLEGVDLDVRRGEIVGVAGIEGNGQGDLAGALAGFVVPEKGSADLPPRVSLIPQDRIHEGLIGDFSILENVALGFHDDSAFRRGPVIDWHEVRSVAATVIERFDVRASGIDAKARTLSGGNQQKVAVGREVMRSPDLVVAENPTRGLDIRATQFVRSELVRLRDASDPPGIVLISTDLDEVLELADRIFVLVRGELTAVESSAGRERIGALMLGVAP